MGDIFEVGSPKENTMIDDKDCFEKLLFAEFDYAAKGFLSNEELGERRVSFFITLSTAVLGALVALSTEEIPLLNIQVDSLSIIFGSFALFLFGLVTLMRMIQRNIATDKYKIKLDSIRRYFVKENKMAKIQYLPYGDPFGKTPRHKIKDGFAPLFSLSTGGLVQTVALMNSLIMVVLVFSLLSSVFFNGELIVEIASYGMIGLIIFSFSWAGQMAYVRKRYRDWKIFSS